MASDNQPLTREKALLPIYTTGHHTYFTGWQTKVAARVGSSKRNVNPPVPLIGLNKQENILPYHEKIHRASFFHLPATSKATGNLPILIPVFGSLSEPYSGTYIFARRLEMLCIRHAQFTNDEIKMLDRSVFGCNNFTSAATYAIR
jgi:hypothetical protein